MVLDLNYSFSKIIYFIKKYLNHNFLPSFNIITHLIQMDKSKSLNLLASKGIYPNQKQSNSVISIAMCRWLRKKST